MGTQHVSINRQVDKEAVVPKHMEYCSAIKKKEILAFATTSMALEYIMLSEIS